MKTITIADQIKASQAMYDKALENINVLSDVELLRLLTYCSPGTIDRIVAYCSPETIARVQSILSAHVPIVEDLDRKVLKITEAGSLKMDAWHCGTTHCRYGSAIHLAGEAGYALEKRVGPEMAGRMIYEGSTGRIAPNPYASNDDAIADIRRCAAL